MLELSILFGATRDDPRCASMLKSLEQSGEGGPKLSISKRPNQPIAESIAHGQGALLLTHGFRGFHPPIRLDL